ncbi:MAG: DUF4135 domain-containing protein [Lachnospiraceae bacterium]|nr:DUF4135 domain-containing protein [Lachnospiraceae bacterium]
MHKSLFGSSLIPIEHNGSELSVLADTDSEYSSAPVVSGKSAGFEEYQRSFFEGFRKAYRSCLDKREELEEDIPKLFSDVPLRVIFVNSQYYGDLMERTWRRRVLDNEDSRREIGRKLEEVLSQDQSESKKGIIQSEKAAILRSDIP